MFNERVKRETQPIAPCVCHKNMDCLIVVVHVYYFNLYVFKHGNRITVIRVSSTHHLE